MKRHLVYTNSILLSLASAGCELIADFEKDRTSAAGAEAGGRENRGGATSSTAGALPSTLGDSIGNAGATTGGSSSSVGGTAHAGGSAATSSGGLVGTMGGATSTSFGGQGGSGGMSATVTSSAGAAPLGGSGGDVSTGGVTTGTGSSTKGGASTGGFANAAGSGTGGAASNPCAGDPCQNAGICSPSGSTFTCKCPMEYTGPSCENARLEWIEGSLHPMAMSADGQVVVGGVDNPEGSSAPVRWTKQTGVQRLHGITGPIHSGLPFALNADGTVIVGGADGIGAFRWTAVGGAVPIGTGAASKARAVSSDGRVIIGTIQGTEVPPTNRVFHWTAENGAKDILTLGKGGVVFDTDETGTAFVGTYVTGERWVPFRWSANSDLVRISDQNGDALSISLDGSTVVGLSSEGGAFVSSSVSGYSLLALGKLTDTEARAVNANGSVIAGKSAQGGWVWDKTNGARLLREILESYGIAVGTSVFYGVRAISADGKVLVGDGHSPLGNCWIARI